MKSRKLQHCQHIVSGLNQIITAVSVSMLTLFAVDKVMWYVPTITFSINFILTRLSSEISYQTSLKIIEERMRK